MGKVKMFDILELFFWFYFAFMGLWMISGSWVAFVANLCIALVDAGLAFVSVYIIIGACKLVEECLREMQS